MAAQREFLPIVRNSSPARQSRSFLCSTRFRSVPAKLRKDRFPSALAVSPGRNVRALHCHVDAAAVRGIAQIRSIADQNHTVRHHAARPEERRPTTLPENAPFSVVSYNPAILSKSRIDPSG
jgi:hypothetical protein